MGEADNIATRIVDAREAQDDVEARRLRASVTEKLLGASSAAPVRVDRFVILERLGSGGLGVVYSAYDPQLDRRVALKLIRPDTRPGIKLEEARARLLREAQAMAKLAHPNVLPVHDVGTHGEDVFIVLDLAVGSDLRKWVENGPHPWRNVLEVFVAAGQGLAAAHRAGLVHRDFKPANVLLGDDGRVLVMDFGLAAPATRTASQSGEEGSGPHPRMSSFQTSVGVVMGTPAYMAPEQHAGEPLDERADQFAFCVSLYEALWGERPFRWKGRKDVLAAREAGARAEGPRDSRVPARVRDAVLRGLALRPEDRWPDMGALLAELARDPRRMATRTAAGLMVLAALVSAGTAYTAQSEREAAACEASTRLEGVWDAKRRSRVEMAFRAMNIPFADEAWVRSAEVVDGYVDRWAARYETACRSVRSREEEARESSHLVLACLEERLWELEGLSRVLGRAGAGVVENAVQAASELTPLAACDRDRLMPRRAVRVTGSQEEELVAIRVGLAEARSLLDAGEYAAGLDQMVGLVDRARSVGFEPVLAEALLRQGALQIEAGRFGEAKESLSEAAWLAESVRADRVMAEARIKLVLVVGGRLREYEEAAGWGRHARAALARLGGDPILEAELLSALGILDRHQGAFAESQAKQTRAVQLLEEAHGRSHLAVAAALKELGNAYYEDGQSARAFDRYTRALQIREAWQGTEHPAVGTLHNNIGIALLEMGRQEEAVAHAERSLEIWNETLPANHPNIGMAHMNYGNALRAQKRMEEARVHHERAVEVTAAAMGENHPRLVRYLNNLGHTQREMKRWPEARASFERAVKVATDAFGERNPDVADAKEGLAEWYTDRGRDRDAAALLEEVLEIRQQVLGAQHPEVTKTRALVGLSLLAAGDEERGRIHLEGVRKIRAAVAGEDRQALDEALGDLWQGVEHALQDLSPFPRGTPDG